MKISGDMRDGSRNKEGGYDVYIEGGIVSPQLSQAVINHSPDGFAWGYSGSGPAQLALALLLIYTDPVFAKLHYQDFKAAIISKLPEWFEMDSAVVIDWAKENGWIDVR